MLSVEKENSMKYTFTYTREIKLKTCKGCDNSFLSSNDDFLYDTLVKEMPDLLKGYWKRSDYCIACGKEEDNYKECAHCEHKHIHLSEMWCSFYDRVTEEYYYICKPCKINVPDDVLQYILTEVLDGEILDNEK